MQVSHLALMLEPIYVRLAAVHPLLRILDLGCGSSYLTLALAWCFRHRWNHPVRILGIDRDPVVIRRCRRSAAMAGLEADLRFEVGSIEAADPPAAWERAFGPGPDGPPETHVLVALHACDAATDDALALGAAHRVDLIAAAPCCQAELARCWAERSAAGEEGAFAPVWNAPHLRRRVAADLTDALRALVLAAHGYQVTAMEFVSAAHTPKNTLLRAVRTGRPDPAAADRYRALRDAVGGDDVRLAKLLPLP
jgi:predicted RNA methylase